MNTPNYQNGVILRYTGTSSGPRYEAWREGLCRGYARTDFDPNGGARIDCEARLVSFSNLKSVAFKTSYFIRSRSIVSLESDDFILAIAASGTMNGTYAGRDVKLPTSRMGLIDLTSPATLDIQESARLISTRIPRRALLSICPNAENRLGRTFSNDSSLRELIMRYSAISVELGPRLDVIGQDMMAQHFIDLVVRTIGRHVHCVRSGKTAAGGPQALARPPQTQSQDQRHRPFGGVRRFVVFQSGIPQAFRRGAFRDPRRLGASAARLP